MKFLKRASVLFLTVIILALSLPSAKVTAKADADMYYGKKMLSRMSKGTDLVKVYEALVSGCDSLEEVIYVPDGISLNYDQLITIYTMFYADYPEYFWIAKGTPGYYGPKSDIVAIMPIYATDNYGFGKFDNLATARQRYNNKITELTSGLADKSDYEKSIILHDRLCATSTYYAGENHQNAYGALVQGKAVCNGYARAYQHLLKTVGIPAWYVSGTSRNIGHAWNLVKIDGEWYYSDTTWDDTDDNFDFFDCVYQYMNITTAALLKDHTIDPEFIALVPNATATAANYYVKEDLIFSSFDTNRLASAIARNKDNMAQACVIGDYNAFYNQFYQNTDSIVYYLRSTDDYSYKDIMLKFEDSDTYIFVVDFDVKISCSHIYDNNCDDTCNSCGTYRTPSPHKYTNAYDETCNVCGEVREATPLEWEISVAKTGVYSLKPNSKYTGSFSIDKIIVSDKSGNEVKYNESKGGFPLLAELDYTVKFRYDCSDEIIGEIIWTKTLITDTIFSDTLTTEQGGWYNDAVTYAVGSGLVTGYGGTDKFGTADNIQRQDFVVILARMAGVDLANYQSDRVSFADVPSGAYYEKAILWAADCGITTGYNDGTNRFGVGDKITREQLVTFLYRYAKYQNGGISPEISNNAAEKAAAYPDFASVTDYAEEAIIWALDKGVISGKGGTHIAPAGNALRCEIAQIMYNIFLNDIF